MSDAIILAETRALSKEIAVSQLLPSALRNKPADVLAVVMTGRELGLEPMQSIRGIHIIEGKVSLSSDLMGALVKRSPVCEYLVVAESSDTVATYKTKRKGDPGETVMSFTLEQAKQAGALSKSNWQKYPAAMLRARALAAICRAVYPDLCLGLYDADSGEISEPLPAAPAQAEHISAVKEALRADLRADLKTNVVEGQIVSPLQAMVTRIQTCNTREELTALLPAIKQLSEADRKELRAVYEKRGTEVAS